MKIQFLTEISDKIQPIIKVILAKAQIAIDFLGTLDTITIILNFVVLVLILAWICSKAKIGKKLEQATLKVKETIDASTNAKEDSIKKLLDADSAVQNVQQEVNEIQKTGDENAKLLKEKIEKETEKQVSSIKESTEKIIEANNSEIVSELSKKTSLASIEIAKKHIIEVLEKKPEYHQQFIDESIKEIETGLK